MAARKQKTEKEAIVPHIKPKAFWLLKIGWEYYLRMMPLPYKYDLDVIKTCRLKKYRGKVNTLLVVK